jgi:hypothetical protein
MTSKRKIIYQAVAASAALTFVGVTYNMISLTVPADKEVAIRSVALEHGEPRSETLALPERGVGGVLPLEVEEYIPAGEPKLDRAAGIKRVEDIYRRLEEPGVPLVEREMLEKEKEGILSSYYPAGAGDGEPELASVPENGDNGDEAVSAFGGLDINNVFNKVWGLLQGIIVAWVSVKLGQRSRQST